MKTNTSHLPQFINAFYSVLEQKYSFFKRVLFARIDLIIILTTVWI